MLDPEWQKPFYLSREESDQIKLAIQTDIDELEALDKSDFTTTQSTHLEIALGSLRWGADPDQLNAEHAAVRQNVRRELSAKGIELSAIPDDD
jgi:hypothetical protein